VANQWGRTTPTAPGSSGGGSSSRGVIFPVILSLLFGAAGGYGYFRFSTPDQTTELNALITERARLRTQVQDQTKELDGLTEKLAEASALPDRDATEAAALTDARRQIADLEVRLATLQNTPSDDAARSALSDSLARAQSALAKATAENGDLKRLIADNRRAAAKRESEFSAQLQQLSAEAPKAAAALQAQTSRVERLTADLSQASSRIADLSREADQTASAIAAMQQRIDQSLATIKSLETDKAALETALAAALQPPATVEPPQSSGTAEPSDTGSAPQATARPTRDASGVERALNAAPGLVSLSSGDRDRLKSRLVSGECVTTALGSVFTRVPVIALRNLIRDLKSDC